MSHRLRLKRVKWIENAIAPSYNETSTTVTSADTQLFNAIPTNAPSYSMPTQPMPMNAGDQKGKRNIWIPVVAGVIVLALAFGALSLFTNVFPWSTGKYEEETISPTRRREGTYEYFDGMLILDIITTLDSGGVIKRTVPCVSVSGSGADAAKEVADREYEIQTAVYDMIVVYIGE